MNMNVEALHQMIRVLTEVENDPKLLPSFNLNYWNADPFDSNWTKSLDDLDAGQLSSLSIVADCGTSACACGFAALDPWFRDKGFRFVRDSRGSEIRFYPDLTKDLYYADWAAVREFFNLNNYESRRLFSTMQYKDRETERIIPAGIIRPLHVIKRIEQLIGPEGAV